MTTPLPLPPEIEGRLGTWSYVERDGLVTLLGSEGDDGPIIFGVTPSEIELEWLETIDVIDAGPGDDQIGYIGASLSWVFEGIIDGGPGFDLLEASLADQIIDLDLETAIGGGHDGAVITGIEDVTVSLARGFPGASDLVSFLIGDGEDNFLTIEAGTGVLDGAGGDDFLTGGPNADALIGGPGNDDYFGGGGSDIFSLSTDDYETGSGTWDVIDDFEVGVDVLSLDLGDAYFDGSALNVVDGIAEVSTEDDFFELAAWVNLKGDRDSGVWASDGNFADTGDRLGYEETDLILNIDIDRVWDADITVVLFGVLDQLFEAA
ncbi:MAG: hypothetical protein AAGF19_04715 [Pseudomonadota bacterium]